MRNRPSNFADVIEGCPIFGPVGGQIEDNSIETGTISLQHINGVPPLSASRYGVAVPFESECQRFSIAFIRINYQNPRHDRDLRSVLIAFLESLI
jgi:hypothetical protein